MFIKRTLAGALISITFCTSAMHNAAPPETPSTMILVASNDILPPGYTFVARIRATATTTCLKHITKEIPVWEAPGKTLIDFEQLFEDIFRIELAAGNILPTGTYSLELYMVPVTDSDQTPTITESHAHISIAIPPQDSVVTLACTEPLEATDTSAIIAQKITIITGEIS